MELVSIVICLIVGGAAGLIGYARSKSPLAIAFGVAGAFLGWILASLLTGGGIFWYSIVGAIGAIVGSTVLTLVGSRIARSGSGIPTGGSPSRSFSAAFPPTGVPGVGPSDYRCATARKVRIVEYGAHSSAWHTAEPIRVIASGDVSYYNRAGNRVEDIRVVSSNLDPSYHTADPVRIVKDPGGSRSQDWYRASMVRILDC